MSQTATDQDGITWRIPIGPVQQTPAPPQHVTVCFESGRPAEILVHGGGPDARQIADAVTAALQRGLPINDIWRLIGGRPAGPPVIRDGRDAVRWALMRAADGRPHLGGHSRLCNLI